MLTNEMFKKGIKLQDVNFHVVFAFLTSDMDNGDSQCLHARHKGPKNALKPLPEIWKKQYLVKNPCTLVEH